MKKRILLVMFVSTLFLLALTVPGMSASTNGKFSEMPAFYDGKLFTITFQELPPSGEAAVLAQNKSINVIYQSDQAENLCNFTFISVIDAIQADGFNPLWQEVQIVFPSCDSVVQFTSDNDILAAAAAKQIQLIPTTEVYICAVVGPGPKKP
jgi:hypothetical protein